MSQPVPEQKTTIMTRVGPLNVEVTGRGTPALLWHSLFVDSTTWDRLKPELAAVRRLILIDGPNHGRNPRRRKRFTLNDCVGAAADILDHLGIAEPVDWLGNAWGGHVGILFAAAYPTSCRTLLAIGTPVHALSIEERRRIQLLSAVYLGCGARPVRRPLVDALVGPTIRVQDPDGAAIVAAGFSRAGRRGMYDAIRWLSLSRPDLTPVLAGLVIPTLLATAQDDPMWTVPAARAAAANLRHGAMAVLPGAGHIGPLLHRAAAAQIAAFWRDPDGTIITQRAAISAGRL